VEWAEETGEKHLTSREFNQAMRERGFSSKQSTGGRFFWQGVGLIDKFDRTVIIHYKELSSDWSTLRKIV